MSVSVELNFDSVSEKYVQGLWNVLHGPGLGDRLLELQYTPHLSLGVWDEVELPVLLDVVKRFAREIHDFPLHFSTLGQFYGKEGVVFCAPVFTQDLWNAHSYLHRHTINLRQGAQVHYLPNRWVPHCTLGRSLSIQEKAEAMALLNQSFSPFTARIHRISLVSYYPIQEHLALQLHSL